MDEASEEDYSERRAVVFDKDANVVLKKWARSDQTAQVAYKKHEERDCD